jgi:hypothetical protein
MMSKVVAVLVQGTTQIWFVCSSIKLGKSFTVRISVRQFSQATLKAIEVQRDCNRDTIVLREVNKTWERERSEV